MQCVNKEKNLKNCSCSAGCSIKGVCCECVANHRANGEIPGCFFSKEGEKTWDRSVSNFVKFSGF